MNEQEQRKEEGTRKNETLTERKQKENEKKKKRKRQKHKISGRSCAGKSNKIDMTRPS